MNTHQKQVAAFRIHFMLEGANFLCCALYLTFNRFFVYDDPVFFGLVLGMIVFHFLLHILLVKVKETCCCLGCGIMIIVFMNLFIQFGSISMFDIGNASGFIVSQGLELAYVTQLGLLMLYGSFMASILIIGFVRLLDFQLAIASIIPSTKWFFSLWLLILMTVCIALSIYYFIQAHTFIIALIAALFCFLSALVSLFVCCEMQSLSRLIQTTFNPTNNIQFYPSPCFKCFTLFLLSLIFTIDCFAIVAFNFFSFNQEFLQLNYSDFFLYPVGIYFQIGNLLFFGLIASPVYSVLQRLKCAKAHHNAPFIAYGQLDESLQHQQEEQIVVNLTKTAYQDLKVQVKNQNCAICLEDFNLKSEVYVHDNCMNAFHYVCINQWIDPHRKQCPLCRKPIIS